MTLNILR